MLMDLRKRRRAFLHHDYRHVDLLTMLDGMRRCIVASYRRGEALWTWHQRVPRRRARRKHVAVRQIEDAPNIITRDESDSQNKYIYI